MLKTTDNLKLISVCVKFGLSIVQDLGNLQLSAFHPLNAGLVAL